MIKKLLAGLVPLLAVAASAVMPAAAQAAPHWLSNGVPIPEGVVEPVATSGTLTFTWVRYPEGEFQIKCKINDQERIENPRGGGAGVDELTVFLPSKCKAPPISPSSPLLCPKKTTVEMIAVGGVRGTELTPGPPIRDLTGEMMLEIRCSGNPVDGIHGPLKPAVGKSKLEFGTGSSELEDAFNAEVHVNGSEKMVGPAGDKKITAA